MSNPRYSNSPNYVHHYSYERASPLVMAIYNAVVRHRMKTGSIPVSNNKPIPKTSKNKNKNSRKSKNKVPPVTIPIEDRKKMSEEKIEETKEVSEVGTKGKTYGPKKLKDILSKGRDEWKGNTEREKQIIAKYRANTVEWPDVAGNGDDVYSGAKQTRNNMPVKPGEDVKNYQSWYNDGVRANGFAFQGPFVKESKSLAKTAVHKGQIMPHDLDRHWATVHTAPTGSNISYQGDSAIIYHPDGEIHHIENGAVHQDDMKYTNSNLYNVALHYSNSDEDGFTPYVRFVSNKKTLGGGYIKDTNNELEAKDFKSINHAQNHINCHYPLAKRLGVSHMSSHPKRSVKEVKAETKRRMDAHNEYKKAFFDSETSGKNPSYDPKVRIALQKIRKNRHPAFFD